MTSLEERCGQGGSLAAAARFDNHQRQREGSVERHDDCQVFCKIISAYFFKEVTLIPSLLTFRHQNPHLLGLLDGQVRHRRGGGFLPLRWAGGAEFDGHLLNLVAKSDYLIENNCIFEKVKKITTIFFDRTNTLFARINKIDQYVLLSQSHPRGQDLGNFGLH